MGTWLPGPACPTASSSTIRTPLSTTPASKVRREWAAGHAVLGAGSIDAMGEQVVAEADREGDVMVILGRTLIIWVLDPGWREVPGLWTIPHLGGVENRSFIGGASNA